MKIVGLIRVRNACDLIEDALNHMSQFVDAIYVFDDASTDNTYTTAKTHPFVKKIIRNDIREVIKQGVSVQGEQRNKLLQIAKREENPDYFLYMDVDERFEPCFTRKELERIIQENTPDVITFNLYDFYVTPLDNKDSFQNIMEDRRCFGPEFRRILFFFRATKESKYHPGITREPFVKKPGDVKIFKSDYKVYHYGKALIEKAWDEKCKYYMDYFPVYYLKWKRRIGKFVHIKSDFGRELYTQENFLPDKGVMLHDYRPPSENKKIMSVLKFPFSKVFRTVVRRNKPPFKKYIDSNQRIVFLVFSPGNLERRVLGYGTKTLNIEVLQAIRLNLTILLKIIESDAILVSNFPKTHILKFILFILKVFRIPIFAFFTEILSTPVRPIGILVNNKEQERELIEEYKYTENDILIVTDSSVCDILLFLKSKMYSYKFL